MEVGKLAVDRILDHGDEAWQRDRTAGEPAIAANDGDQPHDQDPCKNLAADMGAAGRNFLELELHRLWHELDERPAPCRQRHQRSASFGELDQGARDRLARPATEPGLALPALDATAQARRVELEPRGDAAHSRLLSQYLDLGALTRARAERAQETHKRKRLPGYGQQALPQLAHGPFFRYPPESMT